MSVRAVCGVCVPDLLLAENVTFEEAKRITAEHNEREHLSLFPSDWLESAESAEVGQRGAV